MSSEANFLINDKAAHIIKKSVNFSALGPLKPLPLPHDISVLQHDLSSAIA